MTKRRFHFKLEPLRIVREHAEHTAMRDLAGELRRVDALRLELGELELHLAETRAATSPASAIASELADRQAYVERVERELEDARLRVAAQEGHVEAAGARLRVASRERETVDKLEQGRRAAHEQENLRRERAAGDEVSMRMHLAREARA
jgi:flagellar export protein FliJ